MGSEWIIIGYGILGFGSLLMFKLLQKDRSESPGSLKSLEDRFDPFVFAIQLLCISIYVFSMMGMSKGVVESYNYCQILQTNSTVSGSLATYNYDYVCFDNEYNEDENIFKLSYWNMIILLGIVFAAMIWFLMLFIKKNVLDRLRGGFR
jgi:hypothetical protein